MKLVDFGCVIKVWRLSRLQLLYWLVVEGCLPNGSQGISGTFGVRTC